MNWSARRQVLGGFFVVLLLLGGIVGWGIFTTIAGAIVTSGQVTIPEHSQVVDHPDGGVVEAILVKNGDVVAAGQTVVRLDRTYLDADYNIASTQLYESEALASRLTAERQDRESVEFPPELVAAAEQNPGLKSTMEGEASLFAARREAFLAQINSLQQQSVDLTGQLVGKREQESAYKEQIQLLESELKSIVALRAKGLAEESRVLGLKRERARLLSVREEISGSIEASIAQQGLIKLEIARLSAVRNEEIESQLREVSRKVSELQVQVKAIEQRLSRLVLVAPMAGLVHELKINTIGSVIRPAEPVLYIIPNTGNIGVTVQVDPHSIDSITINQPATVKFSSFNSRLTPDLDAHVVAVSADAVLDERSGASYFRVELRLNDGEIARLNGVTLLPGMPAEVFISTAAQSPMSYILQPFTDYIDKAMRE